jgi:hypothetical protein
MIKHEKENSTKRTERGTLSPDAFGIDSLLANPDNVSIILSYIGAAIGIGTTVGNFAIKAIKLWMDERKSRKIKIKYQDIEVELSGAISQDAIHKILYVFNKIGGKIRKEDVDITLLDD